jgi:hypothetical protein
MSPKRALAIAAEFFPQVSEDDRLGILWSHTGFPSFWAGDPEVCVRQQLDEYKRGVCPCPDCDPDGPNSNV